MNKGPPAGHGPRAPESPPGRPEPLDWTRLGRSARDTIRLAWPAAVSRTGILLMMTVDTLLVGRFDARELAYFGLAMPVQIILMMLGVGILQGALVLTSQSYGAGRPERAGAIWRMALVYAGAVGLLFALAATQGTALLRVTGQDPELIEGTHGVLLQFAWGVPGMLLYIASSYFLEGIRRPQVAMIVMVAANGVNALLDWVFVFGAGDVVPPMGAEGAVLATSIVRWLIFFAMLAYIAAMPDRDRFGVRAPIRDLLSSQSRSLGRGLRRLGLPIALALGVETGAMASLMLIAGRLGAVEVAATQVVMQIVQFVFMFAVGMGAATAVRVGIAVGARDMAGMRLAGWTGIVLILCLDLPLAALFALAPEAAAGIFVHDAAVLAVAGDGLRVAALAVLVHGVMGVSLSALRGAGDVWTPFAFHSGAFWFVLVPLAAVLSLEMGRGVPGLMTGFLAGTALSASIMCVRFHALTRRRGAGRTAGSERPGEHTETAPGRGRQP
ncbi:MAG: MATE family efflux transporter [Alphaproteobacteria bacterium]